MPPASLPRRPPTRVRKACNRCRRQKQRCDPFRPCSICVYMKVDCQTDDQEPVVSYKRKANQEPSPRLSHSSAGHKREDSEVGNEDDVAPDIDPSHHFVDESSPNRKKRRCSFYSLPPQDHHGHPSDKPASESAFGNISLVESAVGMSRKILQLRSLKSVVLATSAIPGGEAPELQGNGTSGGLLPVKDLIGFDLPDREHCDRLLESYFGAVHWFSLVLYEPRFRPRYEQTLTSGMAHRSDFGFLLLLLLVLSLGAWYRSRAQEDGDPHAAELSAMHKHFLKTVREHFMDIIDEDSLEFVQVCILLGSFYLYHGRPRSSFSMLGAAIKSAQALSLHRDSTTAFTQNITEERKRTWWTIYTWDRFATVVYGRPLGINDQDCDVPMPGEVYENVHFDQSLSEEHICLSWYQIQLNKVYQIASPIIEQIHGIRASSASGIRKQLPQMIAKADQLLQEWETNLPACLSLRQTPDLGEPSTTMEQMHMLQALSLQLTYHNLMIVIHRSILADHRVGHRGSENRHYVERVVTHEVPEELRFPASALENSFKRSLESALQISRLSLRPGLVKLATESHLVSFMGINLFTSSVVMAAGALSEPLSDIAQEAKRGIARTLQVQKSLSNHTILSAQSSAILEHLIQMIFERERQEMLRSFGQAGQSSRRQSVQTVVTSRRSSIRGGFGSCPDSRRVGLNEATDLPAGEDTPSPFSRPNLPSPDVFSSAVTFGLDPSVVASTRAEEERMGNDGIRSREHNFQNEYSALPFITPSIPIASFPVFQNQDKQSPESNHTSITMQQHQQTQNLRPLNAPSSTNVSKQFDNIESVMGAYATIKALTNDEIESGSDSAVGITDLDPSWLPEHGQFWLWNMGAFREEF